MKKNILIVDDDAVSHLLVRRYVHFLYWINRIDSAYDGLEGLRLVQARCDTLAVAPDLILLDLHMPIMDGFQFLESINKMECVRRSRVVVVAVSSSDAHDDRERLEALGVRYVIKKPISPERLDLIANTEFRGIL